jgi:hypothetical protein
MSSASIFADDFVRVVLDLLIQEIVTVERACQFRTRRRARGWVVGALAGARASDAAGPFSIRSLAGGDAGGRSAGRRRKRQRHGQRCRHHKVRSDFLLIVLLVLTVIWDCLRSVFTVSQREVLRPFPAGGAGKGRETGLCRARIERAKTRACHVNTHHEKTFPD